MPKVDLIATKDFTYNTRRLVAAEPFQARNPMDARILTRVRKVAAEPTGIIPTLDEVLGAKVIAPKPRKRKRKTAAKKK